MARYQKQRLEDWLRNPGTLVPVVKGQSIGIHDVRSIEHFRTYLWDLADYRVECVQAGMIWLAPKVEVQS